MTLGTYSNQRSRKNLRKLGPLCSQSLVAPKPDSKHKMSQLSNIGSEPLETWHTPKLAPQEPITTRVSPITCQSRDIFSFEHKRHKNQAKSRNTDWEELVGGIRPIWIRMLPHISYHSQIIARINTKTLKSKNPKSHFLLPKPGKLKKSTVERMKGKDERI